MLFVGEINYVTSILSLSGNKQYLVVGTNMIGMYRIMYIILYNMKIMPLGIDFF